MTLCVTRQASPSADVTRSRQKRCARAVSHLSQTGAARKATSDDGGNVDARFYAEVFCESGCFITGVWAEMYDGHSVLKRAHA